MASCDLCGAKVPHSSMVTLLDAYQVPGVADVCKPCGDWASGEKWKLMGEVAPKMRELIEARRIEAGGAPPAALQPGRLERARLALWRFWRGLAGGRS